MVILRNFDTTSEILVLYSYAWCAANGLDTVPTAFSQFNPSPCYVQAIAITTVL